jgi:HTH-type transcriptional regulator/antitoxin HigA
MDAGIATLKLLMEQHNLGVADLPEIGSKSLVSKILNKKGRTLTKAHIVALSNRFGVSPALFF